MQDTSTPVSVRGTWSTPLSVRGTSTVVTSMVGSRKIGARAYPFSVLLWHWSDGNSIRAHYDQVFRMLIARSNLSRPFILRSRQDISSVLLAIMVSLVFANFPAARSTRGVCVHVCFTTTSGGTAAPPGFLRPRKRQIVVE